MKKRIIKPVLYMTALMACASFLWSFSSETKAEREIPEDTEITIDENAFPDSRFRAFVEENYDNSPADGKLSKAEIEAVTSINCSNKEIESLEGISYFTKLRFLTCYGNNITTLKLEDLEELDFASIVPQPSLTTLSIKNCAKLSIVDLPASSMPENLETIDISGCSSLKQMSIGKGNVKQLTLSGCTSLQTLNCMGNQIDSLDLSDSVNLLNLYCSSNKLTELILSSNTQLKSLACSDNQLTELNLSNLQLNRLKCRNNQISELNLDACADDLRTYVTKYGMILSDDGSYYSCGY